MSARLFAIGDIHGCRTALDALLDAIRPTPADTIVTLGDYIDRGPDSCGVIQRLIQLGNECRVVPILGNHEEMMLNVIRGRAPKEWWFEHGGSETMESYGNCHGPLGGFESIPSDHITWLESCIDFHEEEEWFFTHANYVASEPLASQPAEALRWQNLVEHFPARHVSGKQAIVGHTSQRSGEIYDAGHLVCIDTYCHGGGWLTALELATGQRTQAAANGILRVE